MIDFDTRPIGTDLMWSNIEDLGIDTPIASFVVYFYSVIVDGLHGKGIHYKRPE